MRREEKEVKENKKSIKKTWKGREKKYNDSNQIGKLFSTMTLDPFFSFDINIIDLFIYY